MMARNRKHWRYYSYFKYWLFMTHLCLSLSARSSIPTKIRIFQLYLPLCVLSRGYVHLSPCMMLEAIAGPLRAVTLSVLFHVWRPCGFEPQSSLFRVGITWFEVSLSLALGLVIIYFPSEDQIAPTVSPHLGGFIFRLVPWGIVVLWADDFHPCPHH